MDADGGREASVDPRLVIVVQCRESCSDLTRPGEKENRGVIMTGNKKTHNNTVLKTWS